MESSEAREREVNEREEGSEATGIGNESPDIISHAEGGRARAARDHRRVRHHCDERRVTWTLDICLDIWVGRMDISWIFLMDKWGIFNG